ncbi:glycosyltransferase family 87 protein, partial [Profundibacter sp.]
MIPRSARTAVLLVLFVSTMLFAVFYNVRSPDLLASWMGGHFYQIGIMDQIYPSDRQIYSMLPPDAWMPYLKDQGYDGSVFPFIYPPLWAHIFGWLTTVTTYDTLSNLARAINPVLMGSMVILAWRSMGNTMSVVVYTFIGLLILVSTTIGFVPIYQNQSQILVSFLIVLAIERSRYNAPVIAGVALAIAASIKLYPALFALFWLASGNRKAFGSFIVAGLVLAGASVLLAGWPLHQTFLHEV